MFFQKIPANGEINGTKAVKKLPCGCNYKVYY